MGKYRDDISERSIKFDLINGKSVTATAKKFGCSEGFVRTIRDGKRKAPPVQPSLECVPAEQLCCCCGVRPIAPGNRFLCDYCHRYGDVGTIC